MLLCSVAQSCPTACDPLDCSPPGLICIYMCVFLCVCVWKFSEKVIFKLKLKG